MDHRKSYSRPINKQTCIYWKKKNCLNGDRCFYLHAYICQRDGACTDPSCRSTHFKQRDPSTYLKVKKRPRSGSREDYRRSYSPYGSGRKRRSYSRSPRRSSYTRSPFARASNSPSPRRYSRTPNRHPYRQIRSPNPHHYSNSPNPLRYSYSPKRKIETKGGDSPKRKSRKKSISNSPSPKRTSKKKNKPDSITPKRLSRKKSSSHSPSNSPSIKKTSRSSSSEASNNEASNKKDAEELYGHIDDVLTITEDFKDSDLFNDSPVTLKSQALEDRKNKSKKNYKPIGVIDHEESTESHHSPFPSSKALEILNQLPKNLFPSDKEKSASEQEAFKQAFLKALEQNETGNTSSKAHGEVDKIGPSKHPLHPESLAKPFQENLYGNDDVDMSLWTPALGRHQKEKMKPEMTSENPISNWEIDTPYISRNKRSEKLSMPAPPPMMAPSAMRKPRSKSPEDNSSKKKKKRRRRRHSSSLSSSSASSGDEKTSKKKPGKMNQKENEEALEKKKNILSKVWSLMGQKKKLEMQRDEIVLTHKGDAKSLTALLQENSNLSTEIDKQIFLMNQMVMLINDKLGISKLDTQQQEFYIHSKMFSDEKGIPKNPDIVVDKSSLEKSLNQYLKSSTESTSASKKSKHADSKSAEEKKNSPTNDKKLKHHKKSKKSKREKSTTPPPPEDKKKRSSSSFTAPKSKSTPRVKESSKEYAPTPSMKPHIKYIDQGMHWCKICGDFFDSVHHFIAHLESREHLDKLKHDKKEWLTKSAPIEKEKVQPGAPVITIPLQGMEFIHSMTVFYCSLCDNFIKSKMEAENHMETKLHVSKYKEFLSKDPMFETTNVKQKMAAFARYSVEKEKSKERERSVEVTNEQSFFDEVRRKTVADIEKKTRRKDRRSNDKVKDSETDYPEKKEKPSIEQQNNLVDLTEEKPEDDLTEEKLEDVLTEEKPEDVLTEEAPDEISIPMEPEPKPPVGESVSLLNISSLSQSYRAMKEAKSREMEKAEEERKSEANEMLTDKYSPSDISFSEDRDLIVSSETTEGVTPKQESKLDILKKKLAKENYPEDPDESANEDEKKKGKKVKNANFFIGKMPFLKKPKPITKTTTETEKSDEKKDQPAAASATVSEAEERIRNLVSQGLPKLKKESKVVSSKQKNKVVDASQKNIAELPMPPVFPQLNSSPTAINIQGSPMNFMGSPGQSNHGMRPSGPVMGSPMNFDASPRIAIPTNFYGPEPSSGPKFNRQPRMNFDESPNRNPNIPFNGPPGMNPNMPFNGPPGMNPNMNFNGPPGMSPNMNFNGPPPGMNPNMNFNGPPGMNPNMNFNGPPGMNPNINFNGPPGMNPNMNFNGPPGINPNMNFNNSSPGMMPGSNFGPRGPGPMNLNRPNMGSPQIDRDAPQQLNRNRSNLQSPKNSSNKKSKPVKAPPKVISKKPQLVIRPSPVIGKSQDSEENEKKDSSSAEINSVKEPEATKEHKRNQSPQPDVVQEGLELLEFADEELSTPPPT